MLVTLLIGIFKFTKIKGEKLINAVNEYNWALRKKKNIPLNVDIRIEKEKQGLEISLYL